MRESGWTTKPMRAVLRLYKPPRAVHAPQDQVSTLGIRWYGLGLFAKPGRRSDIKGESYYQLKPGTVVYSKLFAWKQSFGVVTDEFAHLIASNEFPSSTSTASSRPPSTSRCTAHRRRSPRKR